jgi:hypothetical protein
VGLAGYPHTLRLHTPHIPAAHTHPAQPPHNTRTPSVARSAPPARCCPSDSTRSARPSPPSSATHRLYADTASSHYTPARCLQASSPPHLPNSRRSSPGYTLASARRHTLFGRYTDTPALPAHPASTPEHHRCCIRTHTPLARHQTRNPALSSPTDPPHHTQTPAHNCSAPPTAPKCPRGSTQNRSPHLSTHPAPMPTVPTPGRSCTHPSANRSAASSRSTIARLPSRLYA